MMANDTVWVVMAGYDNEGFELVGVFGDDGEANALLKQWQETPRRSRYYGNCKVQCVKIGELVEPLIHE
jgi:hypothetical protein